MTWLGVFIGIDDNGGDVPGGALGAPVDVQASSEVIAVNTDFGPKNFAILDILSIMRSKLGAYFARASQNDYVDIAFLVER
jgi:hypothetical protein